MAQGKKADLVDRREPRVEQDVRPEERPKLGTLSALATDPKAETQGVWFEDVSTGISFLIAHQDNENAQDYLQELIAPYATMIQSRSKEGFRAYRQFEAKARARFVMLGWKNLTDDHGKEIPYSEEMAFELLTDPRWRKIRNRVEAFSRDDTAFGPDRKAMGKDLLLTSAGT
jgi:hypothetical protein